MMPPSLKEKQDSSWVPLGFDSKFHVVTCFMCDSVSADLVWEKTRRWSSVDLDDRTEEFLCSVSKPTCQDALLKLFCFQLPAGGHVAWLCWNLTHKYQNLPFVPPSNAHLRAPTSRKCLFLLPSRLLCVRCWHKTKPAPSPPHPSSPLDLMFWSQINDSSQFFFFLLTSPICAYSM